MSKTTIAEDKDPLPTRYTLLSRLHDREDQESWKQFFDTYWKLIYSVAVQSGLTNAEAQDVVQETVISVAKDIEKFKRDRALGSFKGWLRNITRWRIADQLRRRRPAEYGEEDRGDASPLPSLEDIPDPSGSELEPLWEKEWQSNLFEAALERVKRRVKEEHYQIFDLYVVKSWPVLKVARAFGVSVGRVYLIKHRISGLIAKEIANLEKQIL